MTQQGREGAARAIAEEIRKRVKPCECDACKLVEKLPAVLNIVGRWQHVPAKPELLLGRVEHFVNEKDRQGHLKYLKDNEKTLPF